MAYGGRLNLALRKIGIWLRGPIQRQVNEILANKYQHNWKIIIWNVHTQIKTKSNIKEIIVSEFVVQNKLGAELILRWINFVMN